jgi:hypothetical protein
LIAQGPHTIVAEVPQESQIIAQDMPLEQPMPEELSTVQPEEESDIQLATHIQEISSPKRYM